MLTFDGIIVDELLSPKVFKERHEPTSETLHSGTNPTRIIFLDKDGVVINAETNSAAFMQLFDRAGTKPRDAVIIGAEGIEINEHGETSRFIIEPQETSEELHSGTQPTRIIFVDTDAVGAGQSVSAEAFGVEFERSGKEPANALLVDMAAADVREIIDKEVFGVEVTRSGTEYFESERTAYAVVVIDENGNIRYFRIRKLMPIEAWRAQGFATEQFNKVAALGISDSRLYKMAGNAVSVPVIKAIGEKVRDVIFDGGDNDA